MTKLWLLIALVPLGIVAANGGTANGTCQYEGGETEAAPMIPVAAPGSDGFYLHASSDAADGTSGVYAETNGKPGLQVTAREWVCGADRTPVRGADEMILDYVA